MSGLTDDLFAGLLDPIPGAAETGLSLRHGPVHAAIEAARREEDAALPQGVWQRDLDRADLPGVLTLCREALTTRSKDLRVACWMVEAAARLHGPAAAAQGLRMIAALCGRYWDGLHPEHDGEPDSPRFGPLVWLDGALAVWIAALTLVERESEAGRIGFSWSDHVNAQRADVERRRAKPAKKKAAPALTLEDFDAAAAATPLARLVGLRDALRALQAAAAALDAMLAEKGGAQAPSLTRLRGALESVGALLAPILAGRAPQPAPQSAPEPVMEMIAPMTTEPEGPPEPFDIAPAEAAPGQSVARLAAGPVETREQAYRALAEIAAVLRRIEPHSPTPYLIERAARWGGMSLSEVLADLSKDGRDPQMLGWLLGETGAKR